MTDQNSKVIQTMIVVGVVKPHMAMMIMKKWVIVYAILRAIDTDNSLRIVFVFCAVLYSNLDIKLAKSKEFLSQVNGHLKQFQNTLMTKLCYHVGVH